MTELILKSHSLRLSTLISFTLFLSCKTRNFQQPHSSNSSVLQLGAKAGTLISTVGLTYNSHENWLFDYETSLARKPFAAAGWTTFDLQTTSKREQVDGLLKALSESDPTAPVVWHHMAHGHPDRAACELGYQEFGFGDFLEIFEKAALKLGRPFSSLVIIMESCFSGNWTKALKNLNSKQLSSWVDRLVFVSSVTENTEQSIVRASRSSLPTNTFAQHFMIALKRSFDERWTTSKLLADLSIEHSFRSFAGFSGFGPTVNVVKQSTSFVWPPEVVEEVFATDLSTEDEHLLRSSLKSWRVFSRHKKLDSFLSCLSKEARNPAPRNLSVNRFLQTATFTSLVTDPETWKSKCSNFILFHQNSSYQNDAIALTESYFFEDTALKSESEPCKGFIAQKKLNAVEVGQWLKADCNSTLKFELAAP